MLRLRGCGCAASKPARQPSVRLPTEGRASSVRRTQQTDECKTALFEATTDDWLPPKEKHVLTIVRLAGEEETAAQVDAELTKRLQACRSSASATVAAKALLVLRRVASAGHVASLSQAVHELAAVCCEPQGRHAQGEYVSECAGFLRALCLWGGVGTLRDADGLAGRAWASRTVRELAAELPRLQGLTAVALECASLGRSANGALQALRVEIVEDALCLFRLEANAAATLQAGLMALPPAAVAARGGGALELLETFMMHARRAVALHGALADDVSGAQPTAGLDAVLERRRLWPSPSATSAHAEAPARARDDGGDSDDGGGRGAVSAVSALTSDDGWGMNRSPLPVPLMEEVCSSSSRSLSWRTTSSVSSKHEIATSSVSSEHEIDTSSVSSKHEIATSSVSSKHEIATLCATLSATDDPRWPPMASDGL